MSQYGQCITCDSNRTLVSLHTVYQEWNSLKQTDCKVITHNFIIGKKQTVPTYMYVMNFKLSNVNYANFGFFVYSVTCMQMYELHSSMANNNMRQWFMYTGSYDIKFVEDLDLHFITAITMVNLQ